MNHAPSLDAAPDTTKQGDPAWSRLLLVEGTSGVGKSTLIDQLLRRLVGERPPRRLRTILHLTQAHTYGPLAPGEDDGSLTANANFLHLTRLLEVLEWHVRSLTAETKVKFFGIVDTLHLTQCHRPGLLRWVDVQPLDVRLADLGAKLVFLRASRETLWRRGIEPRRHEEFILTYAQGRFGNCLEEIHRYFLAEQSAMNAHLSCTQLPTLVLDADADSVANIDAAYAFWLAEPKRLSSKSA